MTTRRPPDTRWVRREFENIARRARGHNITISDGRTVHAAALSQLLGVSAIRTACGSSPATGPLAMEPTDKPVTCLACARVLRIDVIDENQPTLF